MSEEELMIVTMQASYEADHYDEAVAKGTAIWRDFIDDPDATLPWNASIRVELGRDPESVDTADGTTVATYSHGEAHLSVKVDLKEHE